MSNLADYILIDLLDGNGERRLRFGFNQVSEVELMAGKPIHKLVEDEDNIGLSTLRVLLWGGLKSQDKGITLDRTGNLIENYLENDGDLAELNKKISEALQRSKWIKKLAKKNVEPTPIDSEGDEKNE